MPTPHSYSYAIVRLVPRVERQEFINIGVILYCHRERYLKAVIEPDLARIAALWPDFDFAELECDLVAFTAAAAGTGDTPISQLPPSDRFNWLAAVRSTVLQVSPVHTGLCADLDDCLQTLLQQQVRPRPAPPSVA